MGMPSSRCLCYQENRRTKPGNLPTQNILSRTGEQWREGERERTVISHDSFSLHSNHPSSCFQWRTEGGFGVFNPPPTPVRQCLRPKHLGGRICPSLHVEWENGRTYCGAVVGPLELLSSRPTRVNSLFSVCLTMTLKL